MENTGKQWEQTIKQTIVQIEIADKQQTYKWHSYKLIDDMPADRARGRNRLRFILWITSDTLVRVGEGWRICCSLSRMPIKRESNGSQTGIKRESNGNQARIII